MLTCLLPASFLLVSPRRRYIVGGRYGLASKEFTPSHAVAVFENLDRAVPMRDFSVGIVDDVTQRSLPPSRLLPEGSSFLPPGTFECLFWGMGSDGTVGANKEAIKIIASNTDMHTQVGTQQRTSEEGSGVGIRAAWAAS